MSDEMRPFDRHQAAVAAIEEAKLTLGQAAWYEYHYEVLGEYPAERGKPMRRTRAKLEEIAERKGITPAEAQRMIEHVEALRPTEGQRPFPKRAFSMWSETTRRRRIRVMRQIHPLRLWRLARGLSMQALSDEHGIPYETIKQWEGRLYAPNSRTFIKMAEQLGVEPDRLAGEWVKYLVHATDYVEKKDDNALIQYVEHIEKSGGF